MNIPKIIRCKKCKRLFSDFADHCPECHTRTPKGRLRLAIVAAAVIASIAAIYLTFVMARDKF